MMHMRCETSNLFRVLSTADKYLAPEDAMTSNINGVIVGSDMSYRRCRTVADVGFVAPQNWSAPVIRDTVFVSRKN